MISPIASGSRPHTNVTLNEPAASHPLATDQQLRHALTRAFIEDGQRNTALGITKQAPHTNPRNLLDTLRQQVSENPSFPGLAELSKKLADAAMTEIGAGALTADEQQQAVRLLLQQCRNLGKTASSHPAHVLLEETIGALKTVRFHQSISQLTADSHLQVRGVADLLTLTRLEPAAFAEMPGDTKPHMLGVFLRTASYLSADLSTNLTTRKKEMGELLQPHVDTLLDLNEVPNALAAFGKNCLDDGINVDLRGLNAAVTVLLGQMRANGILPAPANPQKRANHASSATESSERASAVPRGNTSLSQTALRVGRNLVHKFDAYGAVAPMNDKALLALMRTPAPHLTPEQMHAFLNKRVIQLDDQQLAVINTTMLDSAPGGDPEAPRVSGFDEKMRQALAYGTLVLNDDQLESLQQQPKMDSTQADPLKALMEKGTLSEADRQMLSVITDANAPGQIDAWLAHNAKLEAVLKKSDLPEGVRKELLSIGQKMDTELATLKNGSSLLGRLTATPSMLLTMAPLPLAVAFASGDNPYSSSLVAHFSKNAVFMAGLMMNELTNKRTNVEHLLNRYFVTVLANVITAHPTFTKNEHLLENVGFGMGAAVVSGGITLGVFNRDSIRDAFSTAQTKLFGKETGDADIPEEDRLAVTTHFTQGEQIAAQVKLAVEAFKKDSDVSDICNSSLSYLGTMSSELKARFDTSEAACVGMELPQTARQSDPDFYPKMGLVVLTTGIAAALVLLMETLVGKADYAADGVWCASEMLKLALNPEADMQKAVQTFKEIVGLNLVMTAFLGVNKGWDFLDKGVVGYTAGAAVLTGANLTVPGMVGEAAGSAAGKGLSYLAEKGRGARQTLNQMAANARPTRPTEMQGIDTAPRRSRLSNGGAVVANVYQEWQNVSSLALSTDAAGPSQPAATVENIEMLPLGKGAVSTH